MSSLKAFLPVKIQLLDQQAITCLFNQYWYYEDIPLLSELVFNQLRHVSTVEHISGADREDIRFCWRDVNYIIYFESYGQSCWIESETPENANSLKNMLKILIPISK